MHLLRRLLLLCVLVLGHACAEDVVLGRYLSSSSGDDGGADASVADLSLTSPEVLITPLDGGVRRLRATVTNEGASIAEAPLLRVQGPADLVVSGCDDAGLRTIDAGLEWACALPPLGAAVTHTTELELVAAPQVQAAFITLQVTTASAEQNLSNNTARSVFATTPGSGPPLAFTLPFVFPLEVCVGTGITSWAQCVPGSRLGYEWIFFADGGVEESDGGTELFGSWALGDDGGTLVILPSRLTEPAAMLGGTVSATCVEGVIQNGLGRTAAGAFRGCVR